MALRLQAWLGVGRGGDVRVLLAEQSAQGRADARGNGFPFNKYSSTVKWEVVAETPDYLSLSAEQTSYTGGAHGNYGFDSLVWDKQRDRVLQVGEFFTSLAALEEVVGKDLCDLLNAERARRRGPTAAQDQATAGIAPSDTAASSSSLPWACISGISSRAMKGKVTKTVASTMPGTAKITFRSWSRSHSPHQPCRPKTST